MDRRSFLRFGGSVGLLATGAEATAKAATVSNADEPGIGSLVDTTVCVGCRQCEKACQATNVPEVSPPTNPVPVADTRRPGPTELTVVNRIGGSPSPDQRYRDETFTKIQCMHCLEPACVSACIVGALEQEHNGAINYDADRCIGCRYCMVACPFQLPAYEYDDAVAPRVRKCLYCFDEHTARREAPACVRACPTEAIIFGPRDQLLRIAHQRIETRPDRYVDHVYGEHEIGGTRWLYLAGRDFAELGFFNVGTDPIPRLTEAIQHGTFRYGLGPGLLYAVLAGVAYVSHRRERVRQDALAADHQASGEGADDVA